MTKTLEFFKSKPVQNILLFIMLIVWCIGTIQNHRMTVFYNDELHAWYIASRFDFIDIIRLMKTEGHTFIWYMILKPFTIFDYGTVLKPINWIFMFCAVSLFLYKSTFNLFIKTFFIFSYPIFCLYPTYARCYSVGILFMFIIAIMYKDRLKHPVLFSSMIFIAANTSLMATIGILGIAIIFFIDLIKQKDKRVIIPLFILFFCVFSLFIQWFDYTVPANIIPDVRMHFKIICTMLFTLFLTLLQKSKQAFFYLFIAYVLTFYISLKVYYLSEYHTLFLFIELFIAASIINDTVEKEHTNKLLSKLFDFYLIIVCIFPSLFIIKNFFE